MIKQNNLFNEPLDLPQNKKELKDVCCEACYYAEGPDCDCQCHGAYHGLGRVNKRDNAKPKRTVNMALGPEDIFLTDSQAAPFKTQYREGEACAYPHEEVLLKKEPIRGYPHENGWKVQGLEGTWWLYVKCPLCGYDWSIWKLGVDRAFDPTVIVVEA